VGSSIPGPTSVDPAQPDLASPEYATVEALVRSQLTRALGGKRGMLEGAVPTLGFTVSWIATRDLRLSLVVSGGFVAILMVIRLIQRSTIQFVLNAAFGVALATVFALRSGRAQDAFLPGLIYNAVYATVLTFSALIRWPLMGFLIGAVTGDLRSWRQNPRMRSLCTSLTWLLAAPCVLRVLVQFPLWSAGQTAWLGIAKLAMGWPLQVLALAAMVWLLNRDHTPLPPRSEPAAG
jgi:Protein of unknown function (DUF3159)